MPTRHGCHRLWNSTNGGATHPWAYGGAAEGYRPGEGIVYPIDQTDYIKAHIGAISEEMRDSRMGWQKQNDGSGSLHRLYGAIDRLLARGSKATQPLPKPHLAN